MTPRLFCFGLGYSAMILAETLLKEGWTVAGTCRSEAKKQALEEVGIDAFLFDRGHPLDDVSAAFAGVTHFLTSVPPDQDGDPVLDHHGADLAALGTSSQHSIQWVGYLSTTGVYGNLDGGEADEDTPRNPTSARGHRRVEGEDSWFALGEKAGFPVHVFRLAGIYGPGRSAIDQVKSGSGRRLSKPGHKFSRIHVEDIAGVLRASIAKPNGGRAYNVCDDAPSESRFVIEAAAEMLGMDPPPLIPFADAELSPMARTFYGDNKTVSNARIKEELGYVLRYPDYHAGLRSIMEADH
ncbi:MAG: SDR family oxidoreductase [Pseudomonadota bacterium]